MAGDFVLSSKDRATFCDFMSSVTVHHADRIHALDASEDASIAIAELLRSAGLGGAPDRDARVAAGVSILKRYQPELATHIENASSLYEESLIHYWREEDYVFWREDREPVYQHGHDAYDRTTGGYTVRYISSGGGWKIHVVFDSADFPVLEAAIRDIDALKSELAEELQTIL